MHCPKHCSKHCPKTALPRAAFALAAALLCFATITNHAAAAGESTERAWKVLDGGVAEPSVDRRAQAVSALGMLSRDARAERLAVKALGDEKPEVRAAAATALGAMRALSAIPALRKALKDSEVSVVLAAAQSLLLLHDDSAYEVYYEVLTGQRKSGEGLIEQQKKMLEDRKKMTELAVTTGIGFIPFGGIGMTVYKTVTKDDASPVRAAAAKLLARDPDPKSAQALVAAASDKSWVVRVAAVDAIGRRGDRSLAEKIAPQLDDEKSVVQYTAAAAIIHLSELPAARPK